MGQSAVAPPALALIVYSGDDRFMTANAVVLQDPLPTLREDDPLRDSAGMKNQHILHTVN
jgi:hypothetical protein